MIQSERLYLSKITEKDFENTRILNSDVNVMKYIREIESLEQTKKYFKEVLEFNAKNKDLAHWGCYLKGTNEFLGRFVLRHLDKTTSIEIGYSLLEKHWGKGYATEMGKVLLSHAFKNLKHCKVVAVTHPENIGSQKVLEKMGLEFKKKAHYYNADVFLFEAVNPNQNCL